MKEIMGKKKWVWLVWVMQNFEIKGRSVLHSIHTTRESAYKAEKMLVRNDLVYYSIEKKELIDE